MSNIDLHEFNVLSKRHNYFMTNNRINGFPALEDSSIFLQKILSNRLSNSIDKKIPVIKIQNNNHNNLRNYFNMKTYKTPIITQNIDRGNNILTNNNINDDKKFTKNKNKDISPDRSDYYNVISTNRINTPDYYKIPINMNQRIAKSPQLGRSININDDYYNECKVLNYNGKKIFTTESFNNLRCHTKSNSPEKNDNQKESELFRNYEELKKKQDEIYKRKIKRDSSHYRKQILKMKKDKEIKEQTINKDKLKIIPLKNLVQKNIRFSSNDNNKRNQYYINTYQNNENNSHNKLYYYTKITSNKNNKNINNKNHNIIMLQQSRNLYNKKTFKTNNIYISKNLNLNKSKTTMGTPEKSRKENKILRENYNNSFIQNIYSSDRKISIRLHILKEKNIIFSENKKKKKENLKIQKLICINYHCGNRNHFNNENVIKNKKVVKRIKNMDLLCAIKEEEEKSKSEKIINNINSKKEIIHDNINIDKESKKREGIGNIQNRNRYLSRLMKK